MEKEPPSTLTWTLFLLAQHYDRCGQYENALSKIDEAIGNTPSVIDMYLVKSRILKHAGDLAAAAAFADEARRMDLSDRNAKRECVKRMLQADQVALAEKTFLLFTKDGDQRNNLDEIMQCIWYELAFAKSYFRQGDLGQALNKFLAVEKHFADITQDKFVFYSHCSKRMTLRTYVEMFKFQEQLNSHACFHKAVAGAIRCYIKLHDSPPTSTVKEDNDMSKLLLPQEKHMRRKQGKEESSAGGKLHAEKILQKATDYLMLLQKNSQNSLETHVLAFELYMRKQEILLAFQAVKQLMRLDAEHPDSHRCLIKFFHKVESTQRAPVTDSEKHIWTVLKAERQTISKLHETSLFKTNVAFLGEHEDSLMHRAAFGEMLYLLDPRRRSEAVRLIEKSTYNLVPSGTSRTKRKKNPILVDDIVVTECLSRLPVKYLFRNRIVCKQWKSLVVEPDFVKLHFRQFGQPRKNRNLAAVQHGNELLLTCFERTPQFTVIKEDDFKILERSIVTPVSSCNGLLCLVNCALGRAYGPAAGLRVCIINPATRSVSVGLPLLSCSPFKHIQSIGFGHDPVSDTYQSVVILDNRKVKVNNGGVSQWRDIQDFPADSIKNESHSVYLNGTLNWLAVLVGHTQGDYIILSLSLSSETYSQIQLPQGLNIGAIDFQKTRIGALLDKMFFSYYCGRTNLLLWKMNEFGREETWTVLANINLEDPQICPRGASVYGFLLPWSMSINGEILTLLRRNTLGKIKGVIFYNCKENVVVGMQDFADNLMWFDSSDYTESLISAV